VGSEGGDGADEEGHRVAAQRASQQPRQQTVLENRSDFTEGFGF